MAPRAWGKTGRTLLLGVLCAALLPSCQRGKAGVTAETAPPLECPKGAHVQRIDFPEERGGGFAERCVLADGSSRHGPSREWDAEGHQRGITNWWQGMRHGKTTFWHPNGQKSNEAEHYRWQPSGVWTAWDENGKVTDQRDFGPPNRSVGSWPMPDLGPPPDEPPAAAASPGTASTAPDTTPQASTPQPGTPAPATTEAAPPGAAQPDAPPSAAEQPGPTTNH